MSNSIFWVWGLPKVWVGWYTVMSFDLDNLANTNLSGRRQGRGVAKPLA